MCVCVFSICYICSCVRRCRKRPSPRSRRKHLYVMYSIIQCMCRYILLHTYTQRATRNAESLHIRMCSQKCRERRAPAPKIMSICHSVYIACPFQMPLLALENWYRWSSRNSSCSKPNSISSCFRANRRSGARVSPRGKTTVPSFKCRL